MFKKYNTEKKGVKLKKGVVENLKGSAVKKLIDLRQKAKLIDERIERNK